MSLFFFKVSVFSKNYFLTIHYVAEAIFNIYSSCVLFENDSVECATVLLLDIHCRKQKHGECYYYISEEISDGFLLRNS